MKFIALGRTHWLLESIKACVSAGHQLVGIATAKESPEYRATVKDFEVLAQTLRCPFLYVTDATTSPLHRFISNCKPDVGLSVNWPILLPKDLLESVPHGILNAHAGDLPRFRGNACPNWALLK